MNGRNETVSDNKDVAFERSDFNFRTVAAVGIAAFLLIVIAPIALALTYGRARHDVERTLAINPPGPELQIDPSQDLKEHRAAQEAQLDSYGWVDRSRGVVHIPIDVAMQEIAKRGIPDFETPAN